MYRYTYLAKFDNYNSSARTPKYTCIYIYINKRINISFILKHPCIHRYRQYIYTDTYTHTYLTKRTGKFGLSKELAKSSQQSSALSFPSKLSTS